jgi:ADP-heptose:LPS heptosyltransferase
MAHFIKLFGNSYLSGRKMNPLMMGFIVARDLLLKPFFGVTTAEVPDREKIREICVCKLDHLGDVLMIVPALRRLRRLCPQARLTLVVGDWAQSLAAFLQISGVVDEVVICNLALLDRSKKNLAHKIWREWKSRVSSAQILRAKKIDLLFDFRPFSPDAWSIAAISGAKFRIGFGLRGMSSVYHRLIPYDDGEAMGQLFLNGIGILQGEPEHYSSPGLPSALSSARRVWPKEDGGPYLVVQLYSVDDKKNVPLIYWREIIQGLLPFYKIALVGSKAEGQRAERELPLPGLHPFFGQTAIPELIRLVEESDGVLSVDSLSAHIGLAFGKRVRVLYVPGVSNQRAYPKDNPNLMFFDPTAVPPGDVVASLAPRAAKLDG